jgi:hypothetical protein
VKSSGLIGELLFKLLGLSVREENGTPGVRVKSVEIRRNTVGEGDSLDHN